MPDPRSNLGLFFSTNPSTTEFYTLSLHDALPIFPDEHHDGAHVGLKGFHPHRFVLGRPAEEQMGMESRSEEHTSELQSHHDLVCRLLLEKKKKTITDSELHKSG